MNLADLFQKKFGLTHHTCPTLPDSPTVVRQRIALIREEYEEALDELRTLSLQTAAGMPLNKRWDTMTRLLKELADLRYVIDGTAAALGLDIESAYAEVHESNMSKVDNEGNPIIINGKVQKGPNYRPPDIVLIIEAEAHDEPT